VVIASMVSPRERGRYSGYIGAVFALATVSGPLIGGLLVDTVGWRSCFYVGLPVAALAFVVLQRTLHLPVVRREVHIDYLGATLIVGGVSLLLVWVSLAGSQFAWRSGTSYGLVAAGAVVLGLAVLVEARVAREPVIPLRLFRDRTTSLATAASVLIGVAMFGATVYLSQYFQLARGMTPTRAGLMSICMVGGLLVSSILSGRRITRTGRWKRWLVGGMVLVIAGLSALGTIDDTTPLAVVGAFMAVLGLGLGATMQNLVLAVQNNTAQADMGAASSVVTFFRSIGGSVGVSALGAVLSHQVARTVSDGLAALGVTGDAAAQSHAIPDLATLPAPVRELFEHAFGTATGHIFLMAVPFAVLAFGCLLLIREVPLRQTVLHDDELDPGVAAELGVDQPGGAR
jgi:MFS family permease